MWNLIAPVVRWPLYSPGRLAAVVVAVLAVVFIAGELNGDDAAPAAEATPTASASPVTSSSASAWPVAPVAPAQTTATASVVPEETPTPAVTADDVVEGGHTDALSSDPAEQNPSAAAADAAAAFVAAWARPDLTVEAWSAGVQPLVTAEAWTGGLGETDPANTPDVAVSGQPVQAAINAEEGIFDVPTTGTWYRVRVSYDVEHAAWLVSGVEPLA